MTIGDLPTIRVTSPADLIEAVPYLLGFHPTESLVVVGFDDSAGSGRQVAVTARLDLDCRTASITTRCNRWCRCCSAPAPARSPSCC